MLAPLLQLLDNTSVGGLLMLVLALLFLGNKTSADMPRIRAFCFGLAALTFVAHVVRVFSRQQHYGGDLTEATVRGLLMTGLVLGITWILLPIACTLHVWLQQRLREQSQQRQQARKHSEAEQRRREAEAQLASQSPEQEQKQREMEGRTRRTAEAQQAREEARAACELLYQLHAHALGERFPRAIFDDFLKRYLSDDRPPEYVAQRAQQLQEIIKRLADAVSPPVAPASIAEMTAAYKRQREALEATDLESEAKASLLLTMEQKFFERLEKKLEEL